MSLTDHLKDVGSPIRAYIDGISPVLARTQGGSSEARAAAEVLGFGDIVDSALVVPRLHGVDATRAGTAMDFRTRIAFGGFDARTSTAALGIRRLPELVSQIDNGPHRATVLTEAFMVAEQLLKQGESDSDLDRASILLAHCEQIYRGGTKVLNGSVGAACDRAGDGQMFADNLDQRALDDLRSLMVTNEDQIIRWRSEAADGHRFDPNPAFASSGLVGGADADWLIGETLVDCKVYAKPTVSNLRDFIRQLLGYVMLDLDDVLGIRSIAVWLPRQGLIQRWGLDYLLGGDPARLLPTLRRGFVNAANGRQTAVYVAVPERRKRQLLAENRHTPFERLSDLACIDDKDIRYRVARNAVTPEITVRVLAGDRIARVRAGVAKNENAPADVLETLSRDPSIEVRRAVAAHPNAPRPLLKALTADPDRDVQMAARVNDELARVVASGVGTGGGRELDRVAVQDSEIVQINQERNESGLYTKWFVDFLGVLLGVHSLWGSFIPLARGSRIWARQSRRSWRVPESLTSGLPEDVVADLMREDRPAWLRRTVAAALPASDGAVRNSLLEDIDPDIRWAALQRSLDHPDDSLNGLLEDLASTRDARLRFRTEWNDGKRKKGYGTPSELDEQTLRLVAAHPSIPALAIRTLMQETSSDILVNLLENPSVEETDRVELGRRLQLSRSVATRELLATATKIPGAIAETLAADRFTRVRLALAMNPAAPLEAFESLSEDRELSVRLALIENPGAPAEFVASMAEPLLESAADEGLSTVLAATASRSDLELPTELVERALDRLSKSRARNPDVRLVAAADERTSIKTLTRLAKSADLNVRRVAAANAHMPEGTLKSLAVDPDGRVCISAAVNRRARGSCPLPPADGSSGDQHPTSISSVAGTEEASSSDDQISEGGEARRLTRAELMDMAANKRAEVRSRVACNADADPDILALLAGQRRSVQVRRVVAANPNTPWEVLRSLADDDDAGILQALAFNGATPGFLLTDLAGRSVDLALIVALNPEVSLRILDALIQDGEPLVRFVAKGVRADRQAAGEIGSVLRAVADRAYDVAGIDRRVR